MHRAPAGGKLVVLGALLLAVTVWRGWWSTGPAAVALAACTVASGVGVRAVWLQVRPVLWFVALLIPVQLWLSGVQAAALSAAGLLLGVAAAGLVTLTTTTQELLDTLTRALGPLRRVGVDPERVALLLALAVRAVPVLASLAGDVRQARMARGAERSMRAFAVPFVIRAVRHADRLGEALAARGVDD
jgi:biotin transport system permease protein